MKKTKNGVTINKALMVGGALVSLGVLSATEAHAATGTGLMSAVVLTPIVVSGVNTLHFGSFTRGLGGTVTMTPLGVRSVTAGTVGLAVGLALQQPGTISVAGAPNVNIILSVGAADTVASGVNTMVVNAFNLRTNAGGISETVTFVTSPGVFPIGASLVVGAAQVAGTYTGAYDITANYQ